MSFNEHAVRVLPQLLLVIGTLVISQAASFARPDDQDSLRQLISSDKIQATLLFGLGASCFVQSFVLRWLTKRLDEHKQLLARLIPEGSAEE